MKTAVICFTLTGLATAEKIKRVFDSDSEAACTVAIKSRYGEDSITESLGEWTEKQFQNADALIFVGATGIAVRSIAPYVADKRSDPAVLVVDECGTFVIALLSGHLGGANALAEQVAGGIGGIPVITTATDMHGKFAVDVFAKKNSCTLLHIKAAKAVSAALLAGEAVGFSSELPVEGMLPEGLVLCGSDGYPLDKKKKEKPRVGVVVTVSKRPLPFQETVVVIPKMLTLGIGCKKGTEAARIKETALHLLQECGVYQEAVAALASIDLKKEEAAILALSKEWGIPFLTYSAEDLIDAKGEFTSSSFVKEITGVDNVCERSAVLSSENGKLLQGKTMGKGVTTALAAKKGGLRF